MSNTPNYYAIIPAPVRYHEDLTSGAKLLYGEITALANQKGFCWASNDYFAKLYDNDERTIARWIEQLKNINAIRIEYIYFKNTKKIKQRNIYISDILVMTKMSAPDGDKNVCTNDDEDSSPSNDHKEKINLNNTSINNTDNSKELCNDDFADAKSVAKESNKLAEQELELPSKKGTRTLKRNGVAQNNLGDTPVTGTPPKRKRKLKSKKKIPQPHQLSSSNTELEQKTHQYIKYWNKKVGALKPKMSALRTHKADPETGGETYRHIRTAIKQVVCAKEIHFRTGRKIIDVYFEILPHLPNNLAGGIVNLNDFIKIRNFTKKRIEQYKGDAIVEKSWFCIILETLKKFDGDNKAAAKELLSQYIPIKKDPNPSVTLNFRNAFCRATGLNKDKLPATIQNHLIEASKKFVEFTERIKLKKTNNMRSINGYIHVLFELKNFENLAESPHYLRAKSLWDYEFEHLLKQNAYI